MSTMMEMLDEAREHWREMGERVAFLEGVVKTLVKQGEWQSELVLELVKRSPQGPVETPTESTVEMLERQRDKSLLDQSDPDISSFVASSSDDLIEVAPRGVYPIDPLSVVRMKRSEVDWYRWNQVEGNVGAPETPSWRVVFSMDNDDGAIPHSVEVGE